MTQRKLVDGAFPVESDTIDLLVLNSFSEGDISSRFAGRRGKLSDRAV